ncbi:MAG: hypothetical protein ACRDJE_09240 [Dehalococcoidia bacterium]
MPTFYRVVRSDPPTETDFLSQQALGRRLRVDTPENRRIFGGVSVSDTEQAARDLIAQWPQLGQLIAVLDVPEDGAIRYEQTTTTPSHYTLWGTPQELLATVAAIVAP